MSGPRGSQAEVGALTTELSVEFKRRFVLQDCLGEGARGRVYRAVQIALKRSVAIKLLRMEADDPSSLARFESEARVLSRLRHPGVLRLFEYGIDDGTPYLVMELATGPTLRAMVPAGEALPIADASAIGAQLADALEYLHAEGIVHRDVKPDNVFLAEGQRVVLGDFGLALSQGGRTALTESGVIMGTMRYVAPELFDGHPYSPASDMYAFGVTLFELLAGRPPFLGDGAALAEMMVAGAAPRVRIFAPGTPPELAVLVDRLLDRDPGRRIGAAGPVAAEIRGRLAVPAGVAVTGVLPVRQDERARANPSDRPPRAARRARSRALRRAGVALLAAVTLALPFALTRPRTGRMPPAPRVPAERASATVNQTPAENLFAALKAFGATRRADAITVAWRSLATGNGAATPEVVQARLGPQFQELARAIEDAGLLVRLSAFQASVAGRSSRTHPLQRGELPLYLALHELGAMARGVRALHASVFPAAPGAGPVDPRLDDPLPPPWRASPESDLLLPHAVSVRAAWRERQPRGLPDGPYASHRIFPGWTALQFGELPYDDFDDYVNRGLLKGMRETAALVRYEHPAPLPVPDPARMARLEVGLAGTWPEEAFFEVCIATDKGAWRTIAVLGADRRPGLLPDRGSAFLALDPAVLAGPGVRLAVDLERLCGPGRDSRASLDWVTFRWTERGN